METTYYVAKVYKTMNPTIVESFESLELATQYAEIMNNAGKGDYIVLTAI